jgi:1-acyl-sn-glycerol-3-phosphate acyltransferase
LIDFISRAAFATSIKLASGCHALWSGVEPAHPETGEIPQRVYFANHTSNLDAPVIWASLPPQLRRRTRPIAARDYWEAGPIRRYLSMRVLNAVLIERKKVTKSSNPLTLMEAALDAGDSLILFPEGTRLMDEDADVIEFKPGLFHLARKYRNVQFVPVYLQNLSRILPKGEMIFVPVLASARYGAPLNLLEGESKADFLARARRALIDLGHEDDATVQAAHETKVSPPVATQTTMTVPATGDAQ